MKLSQLILFSLISLLFIACSDNYQTRTNRNEEWAKQKIIQCTEYCDPFPLVYISKDCICGLKKP